MRISATIEVPATELARLQQQAIRRGSFLLKPINQAMAEQFRQCAYDNLGAAGFYRPHAWKALSLGYVKRVNRSYATLFVSGTLKSAIKVNATEERGRVSVSRGDCEYALAHQFGVPERNLPDRPYIPIHESGSIVGAVKALVVKAAQLAIRRLTR